MRRDAPKMRARKLTRAGPKVPRKTDSTFAPGNQKNQNLVPGLISTCVIELTENDWCQVESAAGVPALSLGARNHLSEAFQRYQSAIARSQGLRRRDLDNRLSAISKASGALRAALKAAISGPNAHNQVASLIAAHQPHGQSYLDLEEVMWDAVHLQVAADRARAALPKDIGGRVHTGIDEFIRNVHQTLLQCGMSARYSLRSDKKGSPVEGKLVEVLRIFLGRLKLRMQKTTIGHAVKAALRQS